MTSTPDHLTDDSPQSLIRHGLIPLRWHERLDTPPPALPTGVRLADRIEGMLLGLAIGDALGNTSESMNPDQRHEVHGWISGYLPNRHADNRCIGLPSDDTQLAFRLIEQLLADGELRPAALGARIADGGQIYGIGQATREFVRNFRRGQPWYRCGSPTAGNGALMRIAPVLLPWVTCPGEGLWHDTLSAAHLTHADALSTASCLALVHLLWRAIGMEAAPPPDWWLDEWLAVCHDVGLDEHRHASREFARIRFHGTLTELVETHVRPALVTGKACDQTCNRWGSAAYLLETVPSVLYILGRHAHNPRQAMLEAVNHTRDNDTVAAIVGAVVGALHGASALPPLWIDHLAGRMAERDNHRIFVLMRETAGRFGYGISPVLRRQLQLRGLD